MTGLLTVIAVFMTLALTMSAASTIGAATSSDQYSRGRWGIATRSRGRRIRPLNPHERRWQTAMIGGKGSGSRWRDVVEDLEALQRLSATNSTPPAPESYDLDWVEQAVSELEETMNAKSMTEEPPT